MKLHHLSIGGKLWAAVIFIIVGIGAVVTFTAVNSARLTAASEAKLAVMSEKAQLSSEWAGLVETNVARIQAQVMVANPAIDAAMGRLSAEVRLPEDIGLSEQAEEALSQILQDRRQLYALVAEARQANQRLNELYGDLIPRTISRVSEVQSALESKPLTPQERTLMDRIAAERQAVLDGLAEIRQAQAAGDKAAADNIFDQRFNPSVRTYLASLDEFAKMQTAIFMDAQKVFAQQRRMNMLLSSGAVLLVLAMVGAGAFLLITHIRRPLQDAVGFAQSIAAGDLTASIRTQRTDEFGDMIRALEGMRDQLVRVVADVRQGTDNISLAAKEIADGNQDLSSRTEQTASNLEQTAASMEEMSSTIRQSADAAGTANQLVATAGASAQQGGQVVADVISTMEAINESSRKISDIIGVIDGIAFQTNILALNAAVEAARAGEQGRGFAVVAGEVRTLAQRSAQAAKEIKALISDSVQKVEVGSEQVGRAGHTMQEIVDNVQRVRDIIGELSSSAQEQAEGVSQINAAVNNLDQMTQQNAALVEESAAAAASMSEQAAQLANVVKVFKLSPADLDSSTIRAVQVADLHTKKVEPSLTSKMPASPSARPKKIDQPQAVQPKAVKTIAPAPAKSVADGDWDTF